MPSKTKPGALPSYDLDSVIGKLRKLKFHTFSDFNKGSVGVFRAAKGISPWELHADDDEFLYVIEGDVEIVVLFDEGPVHTKVCAGSIFIVPKGHWHRHEIADYVAELWVRPGTTEHSEAEDPRTEKSKKSSKSQDKSKSQLKSGLKEVKSSLIESSGSGESSTKEFVRQVREFAMSLPETYEENPWDHPAFKVKNKTFAWLSFRESGINLTVKLSSSRLFAEDLPFTEASGYGLGQHGWITARFNPDDKQVPLDLILRWVEESYRAVAPKSILKNMDSAVAELPGVEVKRIKKLPAAQTKKAKDTKNQRGN